MAHKSEGRFGRVYDVNNDFLPSVTALINQIEKDYLVGWATTLTAQAAWDYHDRHTSVTVSKDAAVKEVVEESKKRQRAARDLGTEVHAWIEKAVEQVWYGYADVPDEWLEALPPSVTGRVQSALDFLDRHGLEVIHPEFPMANIDIGYAGTIDAVCDRITSNGREIVLLDWKTGKGVYPEYLLQLHAYAMATHYQDGKGKWREYEEDKPAAVGVVHLMEDGWDYYEKRLTGDTISWAEGYFALLRQLWDRREEVEVQAETEGLTVTASNRGRKASSGKK